MLNLDWRPPTMETARTILRPLDVADATDVFIYSSNPNMTRFTLWDTHETLDDSLLFVREYSQSRYQNLEPDPLGIILKDDPTQSVIGSVGCFWASRKDAVMEIGYNLAEPYWGRGIVLEAARAMVDYVFREFPLRRLQARVLGGNAASSRIALKLAMKYEGTLRSYILLRGHWVDVEYYSMLRTEWTDPRK